VRGRPLLVFAVTLVLATPAFAARPAGDAKYRGTTSQDRKLSARVTSDSKGLQLEFDQVYRCNRGPRKYAHAVYRKQRPTIREDGTFDYRKTYRALPPVPGFERRDERQHVFGGFSGDNRRLKGTVETTVTGVSGLRCTSRVTFSARRI
jgi:hypothetical protein